MRLASTHGWLSNPSLIVAYTVIFASCMLFNLPSALASTVKVNGTTATPRSDNANVYGGGTTGTVGLATVGWSTEFIFKLPPLPAGQYVSAAAFAFSAQRGGNSAGFTTNADLYALPARTSATALSSDYFNGPFDTDPNATALADDVLTAALSPSVPTPITVSNAALVNYLNAAYAAGLPASSTYAFLRLSPDYSGNLTYLDGYAFYSLSPAPASSYPTLSLTFSALPEPAVPLFVLYAAAVTLARRRV